MNNEYFKGKINLRSCSWEKGITVPSFVPQKKNTSQESSFSEPFPIIYEHCFRVNLNRW